MEDWAATIRLVEDEVGWVDWEGKGGVLIGGEGSSEEGVADEEAYMTNILSTSSLVEEEVGSKAGSSSGLKVVVVSSNSKPNFLIKYGLIHAD